MKIRQAKQEAEEELLRELTPEQKDKATELLGEFLEYSPRSGLQRLLDDALAKRKEKAGEEENSTQ